jgi:hypothetical protein
VPDHHFCLPPLPEEVKLQKILGSGDLVREAFVPGELPNKGEDQRDVLLCSRILISGISLGETGP